MTNEPPLMDAERAEPLSEDELASLEALAKSPDVPARYYGEMSSSELAWMGEVDKQLVLRLLATLAAAEQRAQRAEGELAQMEGLLRMAVGLLVNAEMLHSLAALVDTDASRLTGKPSVSGGPWLRKRAEETKTFLDQLPQQYRSKEGRVDGNQLG